MLGPPSPAASTSRSPSRWRTSFPGTTSTATWRPRSTSASSATGRSELLRRAGPAQHRPGRLLQAAAGHVLRGHPLRAQADRDGQPQPGPPLVPRLRPRRGPARPLQPDPHPAAAWASTIFQRFFEQVVDCARRRAWSGARSCSSTPPRSGPTPTSIRSCPASTTRPRPTSPTCSPTTRRPRTSTRATAPIRRPRTTGSPRTCCACRPSEATAAAPQRPTALEAAGGAAAGPAPAGGRQLPAHDRLPRQPDRPRRHADADRERDGLGYHDHYVVDGGKARIILAALVTPADVMENVPMRDLLWRVCFRRKLLAATR